MVNLTQALKKHLPIVKLWFLWCAYIFIFLAVVSVIFRTMTPLAGKYKTNLEKYLSAQLSYEIHIANLETGWYWFAPIVKAKQVTIGSPNQPLFAINELDLGINLFSSLLHWRLQPGYLFIDGLVLKIQQTNNNDWLLQNINISPKKDATNIATNNFIDWVLEHQTMQVKNLTLELSLYIGKNCTTCQQIFKFNDFSAIIVNGLGRSRLKGNVKLSNYNIDLNFGAEFVNPLNYANFSGHTYLKFSEWKLYSQNKSILSWLNQYVPFDYAVKQGRLSGEVWTDFSQGKLQGVNTEFNLKDLVWLDKKLKKQSDAMQLSGHLSFQKTQQGFELFGENLKIKDKSSDWPSTRLKLTADLQKDNYSIYIQELAIDKILKLPIRYWDFLQQLKIMNPSGVLKDFQINKNQKDLSILTAFTNLNWKEYKEYPKAKNVSGVFAWQQDSARIAIDSKNLILKWPHKNEEIFSNFNLDLIWNHVGINTEYRLLHLVLNHPNLKLKSSGLFTQDKNGTLKSIDLKANFELFNATYWLNYLTKSHIKPKLYRWLHDDIHRLDHAIGMAIIKGPWQKFPFANNEGEFKIITDLEDVDLLYSPGWTEAKNITGRLTIDKRNLSAEITKAKIGRADIKAVNLSIGSLGLDKERLLLHGLAHANAEDAWRIILASPLGKKRSFYSSMSWQNTLDLNLNLDIALYPGNDEVLLKGIVNFNNNILSLTPGFINVKLDKLTGKLNFDQQGLDDSQLSLLLWHKNIPINIVRREKPYRYTKLELHPSLTADELAKVLNVSSLNVINGNIDLAIKFIFPLDTEKTDSLDIYSDLKDLEINFPLLIKKDTNTPSSLWLKFNFNKSDKFILDINYANKIHLIRSPVKIWDINLSLPHIAADLKFDEEAMLLSGEMEKLSLSTDMFNKSTKNDFNVKPKELPALDVVIKNFKYEKLELGNLNIKAQRKNKAWYIPFWELHNVSYDVTGSAAWKLVNDEDMSELKFTVNTKDVHKMLQVLGWNPILEAGKMQLTANLKWDAPLWTFKLHQMQGDVAGKITNGRTMNLSKQTETKLGLVKILSLFSLQTIPRRLQLDFSDLSHEGYSFDEVNAEFSLNDSILETKSCKFEGPVASTDVFGRIDLDHELYDLIIKIAPHITASLPVVATIAGGPVAGAATWLASRILNKGMQQIASYTYRVTGSWSDPVVEPFKINKKSGFKNLVYRY